MIQLVKVSGFDLIDLSEIERATQVVQSAHAKNTLRAYRADVAIFTAWCGKKGLQALPALPETVVLFLVSQFHDEHKSIATIARRVASIRKAHLTKGYSEPPTNSELVKNAMKGLRRESQNGHGKSMPITSDIVNEILTPAPHNTKETRDAALISLGFGGALRRSELAALNVEDLEETPEGYKVTIRKSKTDKENKGHIIALLDGKMGIKRKIKQWLAISAIQSGALFRPVNKGGRVSRKRITTDGINAIVKRSIKATGRDNSHYSAHGLRSGFLTSAAQNKADVFKMMEVSRHKSLSTLTSYVKMANLFNNHAGAAFL